MTSKTLYIHVGNHKTGTTSIQQALVANPAALEARGLQYFWENYREAKHNFPDLHSWLWFDHEQGVVPNGMRLHDPQELAERLAARDSDVIVSSENFSFVFDPEEITRLQSELRKWFSAIKIICYLRRQDRHVISHHQEGSKLRRRAEYDLFGSSTLAIPPYNPNHALYLDYHKRLGMWADAFGDQNMIFRVFERSLLKDGDVVADFFGLFGIEDFEPMHEHNTSRVDRQAKLGHLINQSDTVHKGWLNSLLMERIGEGQRLQPARQVALDYYQNFRESNRLFNQRFSVSPLDTLFDEDFSNYPEESSDQWTEESAGEFVIRILEIFDEVYGELTADDLRDAAIRFEKNRLETSMKFMQAAHKIRPDGPIINKKLQEYEERLNEAREAEAAGENPESKSDVPA